MLKKTINIIKKSSEAEAKKNEEKRIEKKSKPKGMGAKRLGMITFWLLFSFMFLVTMVTIIGNNNEPVNNEISVEKNKLYENEGLEFARDFVYHFFTWKTDKHGEERRRETLKPYFLNDIDELGGIIYDDEWESSIDKRDIVLKDVQEINEKQARYIFKVKFTQRSKTDEKDTKINPDKLSFKELIKEERKMKVINGYKTKISEKYISVPVYYNENLNRFAVFDLPSFTYIKEDEINLRLVNNLDELNIVTDQFVENNVRAFLNTFFESYTKDGKDKLSYILEDERHQNGLNGTMLFSEVKEAQIYHADENNNRFIVNSKVLLEDPSTKFEYINKFLLVIKRVDQRYVVESLNDEKYVSELIDKYIEKTTNSNDLNNELEVNDNDELEDFNYQDVSENNELNYEDIDNEKEDTNELEEH